MPEASKVKNSPDTATMNAKILTSHPAFGDVKSVGHLRQNTDNTHFGRDNAENP